MELCCCLTNSNPDSPLGDSGVGDSGAADPAGTLHLERRSSWSNSHVKPTPVAHPTSSHCWSPGVPANPEQHHQGAKCGYTWPNEAGKSAAGSYRRKLHGSARQTRTRVGPGPGCPTLVCQGASTVARGTTLHPGDPPTGDPANTSAGIPIQPPVAREGRGATPLAPHRSIRPPPTKGPHVWGHNFLIWTRIAAQEAAIDGSRSVHGRRALKTPE